VNRVAVANLLALVVAVATTAAIAWPRSHDRTGRTVVHAGAPRIEAKRIAWPGGGDGIADASARVIPLRHYQRIVSTNLVTDRLLIELCERDRILAVSAAAAARQRDGYRYRGLPTVEGFGSPEAMVARQPDLVLTNSFGSPGFADRLRQAGIQVFDLGELRGVRSFDGVVTAVGLLLGVPERAERLRTSFASRMEALALAHRSPRPPRALFLSSLGPDLLGGTVGTSYHDIMIAAGLADVAADRYRDWPAYAPEQVLALAPDLIVTRGGQADRICAYPGMDHLGPCRGRGRIVTLDAELLDEPGLGMLEAAEELAAAVGGR
jgi:iron complex transport system substrate-binding protein